LLQLYKLGGGKEFVYFFLAQQVDFGQVRPRWLNIVLVILGPDFEIGPDDFDAVD
jgi:hypothetical protein